MKKSDYQKLKNEILDREMERFLDLDEAAEILGVSKSTLRRLDNLKQIRSYRIGTGKHRRFKKKDLLGYIEKNSNMENP
jgi:excisionase family DNA binding protein